MPPSIRCSTNPSTTYPEFAERDVRVAPINKLVPLRKHHRVGLPIFPLIARSVFVDADIVLASTSGWAHGFRTRGRKLVYCYSPARWLYLPDKYLGERPGLTQTSWDCGWRFRISRPGTVAPRGPATSTWPIRP